MAGRSLERKKKHREQRYMHDAIHVTKLFSKERKLEEKRARAREIKDKGV